jgi:hypothetical protein
MAEDTLDRDERHIVMLAAWLNVEPSQVPDRPSYTHFVNSEYKAAWERVYEAAAAHAQASLVQHILSGQTAGVYHD